MSALALACSLAALAGCGGSSSSTSSELNARRADLVRVSYALLAAREALAREVAAARVGWPLIDRGLPSAPANAPRRRGRQTNAQRRLERIEHEHRVQYEHRLQRAARAMLAVSAAAAKLPPQLAAHPDELTGAASPIAGVYETAAGLIANASAQIDAALSPEPGSSTAARAFQRANVDTYIVSFYDGNFDLSLLAKMVGMAYEHLGGAKAFSGKLTPEQLAELMKAYGPAVDQLRPHPWQGLIAH